MRPAALEAAAEFITGISAHGIACLANSEDLAALSARVPGVGLVALDGENGSACELVVVFGGDGNILRAAEWALPRQVPVLGVNLGHIGFLAELESSQVGSLIDHVVKGEYVVEERMTIDTVVRAERGGEELWRSFAINAVSYTHLDVYKRQRLSSVREDRDGQTSGVPVVLPRARLVGYVWK